MCLQRDVTVDGVNGHDSGSLVVFPKQSNRQAVGPGAPLPAPWDGGAPRPLGRANIEYRTLNAECRRKEEEQHSVATLLNRGDRNVEPARRGKSEGGLGDGEPPDMFCSLPTDPEGSVMVGSRPVL